MKDFILGAGAMVTVGLVLTGFWMALDFAVVVFGQYPVDLVVSLTIGGIIFVACARGIGSIISGSFRL